jgi:hypothetical protein
VAVNFEKFGYTVTDDFNFNADWLHLSMEPFPVTASYIATSGEVVRYVLYTLEIYDGAAWQVIGQFAATPEVVQAVTGGVRFAAKFYDPLLLDSFAPDPLNIEYISPTWSTGVTVISLQNYILRYRFKVKAYYVQSDGTANWTGDNTTPTLKALKGGRHRNSIGWGSVLTAGSYAYRSRAMHAMGFIVIGDRNIKAYEDGLPIHNASTGTGVHAIRVVPSPGAMVNVLDVDTEITWYTVTRPVVCELPVSLRFRTTLGYPDNLIFDGVLSRKRGVEKETYIRRHGTWVSYTVEEQYVKYDTRLRNGVRASKFEASETLVLTSNQLQTNEIAEQLSLARAVLLGDYGNPNYMRLYSISGTSFDDTSPSDAQPLTVELIGEGTPAPL